MTKAYDKYYQKENYFGNPYKELLDFIETLEKDKMILDIGCGQGRDTLAIGKLGYSVLGIDSSIVGINQLNDIALKEDLPVKGEIADMFTFDRYEEYDVLLLDSMFHFYKRDIETETNFLNLLLNQVKQEGFIVIFMQKGKEREKLLKRIVDDSPFKFTVIVDTYLLFKEFNTEYLMFVIKKVAWLLLFLIVLFDFTKLW